MSSINRICIIGLNNVSIEIIRILLINENNEIIVFNNNLSKLNLIERDPILKLLTDEKEIMSCDIIVCVNQILSKIIFYDELSRNNNKKFINIVVKKSSGNIFVDSGYNHIVIKENDIKHELIQINSLTCDGTIICNNKHKLKSLDYVKLSNLEGTNIEQLKNEFIIDVISDFSFKLCSSFEDFIFINGTCNYVNKHIEIKNKSFIESCKENEENSLYFSNSIEEIEINLFICSYFASIVASEIIKLYSGIYKPINQWFTYDFENKFDNKNNNLIKQIIIIVGENENLIDELISLNYNIILCKSTTNMLLKNEIENIIKNENNYCILNTTNDSNIQIFLNDFCYNNDIALFAFEKFENMVKTYSIIPFITDNNNKFELIPEEKTYQLCVIKSYPNCFDHLNIWAKELFEFFERGSKNVNEWLKNDKDINIFNDQVSKDDIYLLTTKYDFNNYDDCVTFALDIFYDNYNIKIKELLESFPSDTKNKDDSLFWSSGKRCPNIFNFDINNKIHVDFINFTVEIICDVFNIDFKNYITIENNINFVNNYKNVKHVIKELNIDFNIILTPIKIDKYNWININIKLRASNYNIELNNEIILTNKNQQINEITNNIGIFYCIIEINKYFTENNAIIFKNTYFNLSNNELIINDILPAPIIEIGKEKFNSWYKFIHDTDCTLNEFIKKYNELFNVTISIITNGSTIIYASFLDNLQNNEKLLSLHLNFSEENILTIGCDEDIDLPCITIRNK